MSELSLAADSWSRDSSCSMPVRVLSSCDDWNLESASCDAISSSFMFSYSDSNSLHRMSSCSFCKVLFQCESLNLNPFRVDLTSSRRTRPYCADWIFSLDVLSSSRVSRSISARISAGSIGGRGDADDLDILASGNLSAHDSSRVRHLLP